METFGPCYQWEGLSIKAQTELKTVAAMMQEFGGLVGQSMKLASGTKLKRELDHTKSEDDTDSSNSDLESEAKSSRTPPPESKIKGESKITEPSALELLAKALMNIDNRRTPEIDAYDEKGQETLEEYLERFETYCKYNIKGEKSFWLIELKSKLSGGTLKAFESILDKTDGYEKAKDKILTYDEDMSKTRKKQSKADFKSMKYDKGESVYLYSIQLEKTFRQAYPEAKVKYSETY